MIWVPIWQLRRCKCLNVFPVPKKYGWVKYSLNILPSRSFLRKDGSKNVISWHITGVIPCRKFQTQQQHHHHQQHQIQHLIIIIGRNGIIIPITRVKTCMTETFHITTISNVMTRSCCVSSLGFIHKCYFTIISFDILAFSTPDSPSLDFFYLQPVSPFSFLVHQKL